MKIEHGYFVLKNNTEYKYGIYHNEYDHTYDEWFDWAKSSCENTDSNENRYEAVCKIIRCCSLQSCVLNLSGMNLTSLPEHPPLPRHIVELSISNNKIKKLPDNLPPELNSLDVSDNELSCLPENLPNSIKTLIAKNCKLTGLPEKMPLQLESLNVSNNYIKRLPNVIPKSLFCIDLSHNKIKYIFDFYRDMVSNGHLIINCNPLIKRNLREFQSLSNAKQYKGINIYSDFPEESCQTIIPMIDIIFKDTNLDVTNLTNKWIEIENEQRMDSAFDYSFYSGFLEFMEHLLNYSNQKNNNFLISGIRTIIEMAASDRNLRIKLFSNGYETAGNCHLKLINGYLDMRMLLLEDNVQKHFTLNDFDKLKDEVTKLNILKIIADISLEDNIFKLESEVFFAKETIFCFLASFFDVEIGNNTPYEISLLKKNINTSVVNDLFKNKVSDYSLQDLFLNSSPWLAFAKKHFHDFFYKYENEKNEYVIKHYDSQLNNIVSKILKDNCDATYDVRINAGVALMNKINDYFNGMILEDVNEKFFNDNDMTINPSINVIFNRNLGWKYGINIPVFIEDA